MEKSLIKQKILESKTYSDIADFTVERVIDDGIKKYKKEKDVIKYVKTELHLICTVFFQKKFSFKKLSPTERKLKPLHASTKERDSFVEDFYKKIFENINCKVKRIGDFGCGLNPLNIPLMNLKKGSEYFAYDIHKSEIEFLNNYAKKNFKDIVFKAEVKDLFEEYEEEFDVVLLLKVVPLIERQQKGYTKIFLEKISSKYFVVSFPIKTLSGRLVGMKDFYSNSFEKILEELNLKFKKIEFDNELVYVVKK